MVLWIAFGTILINLIRIINCLNDPNTNTTRFAAVKGDFKIGFLVSVRLHTPGKKNTRNLECGKVRKANIFLFINYFSEWSVGFSMRSILNSININRNENNNKIYQMEKVRGKSKKGNYYSFLFFLHFITFTCKTSLTH
jgi:hypothetical protein